RQRVGPQEAVVEVFAGRRPGDLRLLVVLVQLGEVDDAVTPVVAGLPVDLEHDLVVDEHARPPPRLSKRSPPWPSPRCARPRTGAGAVAPARPTAARCPPACAAWQPSVPGNASGSSRSCRCGS